MRCSCLGVTEANGAASGRERHGALARKQTACGGKEGSIRRAQLGSMCLATKNLELVAEDDDLELLNS